MTWMMKTLLGLGTVAVAGMMAAPARAQETGESLFKAKCAMCHGTDGSGKTAMGEKMKIRDLHSADVQKQTEDELHTIIAKGKNKMPTYEAKLSKEQIDKLVAHIRTFGKKN